MSYDQLRAVVRQGCGQDAAERPPDHVHPLRRTQRRSPEALDRFFGGRAHALPLEERLRRHGEYTTHHAAHGQELLNLINRHGLIRGLRQDEVRIFVRLIYQDDVLTLYLLFACIRAYILNALLTTLSAELPYDVQSS